jgi:hypothetical protein
VFISAGEAGIIRENCKKTLKSLYRSEQATLHPLR